jgi:hypothetical protein
LFVWSSWPFFKLIWSVSPKSPRGRGRSVNIQQTKLDGSTCKTAAPKMSRDPDYLPLTAASSSSNTFLPPARSLLERCASVCGRLKQHQPRQRLTSCVMLLLKEGTKPKNGFKTCAHSMVRNPCFLPAICPPPPASPLPATSRSRLHNPFPTGDVKRTKQTKRHQVIIFRDNNVRLY